MSQGIAASFLHLTIASQGCVLPALSFFFQCQ